MTLDEAIKHAEDIVEQNTKGLEDAIALEGQNTTLEEIEECEKCAAEHRQLAEWLKDYKRLKEQEPKWIPVSKKLPESNGVYIVTREFSDGFECVDLTDACYFDGTSTWHNDNRINHDREYVDKKIKAWMPLPEPY